MLLIRFEQNEPHPGIHRLTRKLAGSDPDVRRSSEEQLDDNLAAIDVKLTADDMQKLEAASAFQPGYPYSFIANIQKRWY